MSAVDRVVRTYTQRIEAPPERVFPLLCPVREAEWLDGWAEQCRLVHSKSGVAEEGCVFVTRGARAGNTGAFLASELVGAEGRPDTVWIVTRHDQERRRVEFFRVTPGLVATQLAIAVEGQPDGTSAVAIAYTFTPLGDAGRIFVKENHGERAFHDDMAWWERSMNHWLRTGEMLRRS